MTEGFRRLAGTSEVEYSEGGATPRVRVGSAVFHGERGAGLLWARLIRGANEGAGVGRLDTAFVCLRTRGGIIARVHHGESVVTTKSGHRESTPLLGASAGSGRALQTSAGLGRSRFAVGWEFVATGRTIGIGVGSAVFHGERGAGLLWARLIRGANEGAGVGRLDTASVRLRTRGGIIARVLAGESVVKMEVGHRESTPFLGASAGSGRALQASAGLGGFRFAARCESV